MRRSSRLATSAKEVVAAKETYDSLANEEIGPQSPSEDDGSASKPPARKRRKTKAATNNDRNSRPRRCGKLSALPDMPMDILYEIFRSLHPADLLHLSRTTKAFRALLMSRMSSWLWKDSYAVYAHDLPPIPDDMTIPQFMSLVYDRICYFCNAPNVNTIVWAARAWTCKKCLGDKNTFLPCISLYGIFCREVGQPVHDRYSISFLPSASIQVNRWRTDALYPIHTVRQLAQDYTREAKDQNWDGKIEWYREKAAQYKAKEKHAALCQKWLDARQTEREGELQQARDVRQTDIVRRMTDLGWGGEIEKLGMEKFGKYKHVRKAQKLTEKMWLQIKDELVKYMQEVKRKRLEEELREARMARYKLLVEVYRDYRLAQPLDAILPNVGDIAILDEVTRIIEDTPADQELTSAALRAVLDDIPQSFFDDWRQHCDTALVQVLNSARRKKRATKADLKLATTVFALKDGGSLEFPYPLVLLSSDVTEAGYWAVKEEQKGDVSTLCAHKPWSTDDLGISYSHIAMEVVKLAGLDPLRATTEDMDRLDPWYIQVGKVGKDVDRYAMNWRYVVTQGERDWKFELLGDEQTALAREKHAKEKCVLYLEEGAIGMCAHCQLRFSDACELGKHIKDSHNITSITRKDFVLSILAESEGHSVELEET
ncbi:hypothetical protein K523DRAFT_317401 [Schizophyllum commune Tattone D]|nr:hypothetical protein K523DRAFT_317401 [Schizophyllum commune Tattone D]